MCCYSILKHHIPIFLRKVKLLYYAPINAKSQGRGGHRRVFDVRSKGLLIMASCGLGHLTLTVSGLGYTDAILDFHAVKHADI